MANVHPNTFLLTLPIKGLVIRYHQISISYHIISWMFPLVPGINGKSIGLKLLTGVRLVYDTFGFSFSSAEVLKKDWSLSKSFDINPVLVQNITCTNSPPPKKMKMKTIIIEQQCMLFDYWSCLQKS